MVEIDDNIMHNVRTQTIEIKIDDLASLHTEINDRLYAIMETLPHAKEKFEEIQELRAKVK